MLARLLAFMLASFVVKKNETIESLLAEITMTKTTMMEVTMKKKKKKTTMMTMAAKTRMVMTTTAATTTTMTKDVTETPR